MNLRVRVVFVKFKLTVKKLIYIEDEIIDIFHNAGHKEAITNKFTSLKNDDINERRMMYFLRRIFRDGCITAGHRDCEAFIYNLYNQKKYSERNKHEENVWKRK